MKRIRRTLTLWYVGLESWHLLAMETPLLVAMVLIVTGHDLPGWLQLAGMVPCVVAVLRANETQSTLSALVAGIEEEA